MKKILCLIVVILIAATGCEVQPKKKIGILFGNVGTPDNYTPDWIVTFFHSIYEIFPPGFFAGGSLEGNTCYTIIHYANEREAEVCGVEPGTPIDIFGTPYTGSYPIHSMLDHVEDGSYITDCTPEIFMAYITGLGTTTINPLTGNEILGPHVDDPEANGIGVADFLELSGFSMMDLYARLPNKTLPFRQQLLKWWYGNDAPGYPPDEQELVNIKDMLQEALPQYELVFRHGWDAYAENVDMYGNPKQWPDSFETAIDELINQENVDTLIVACPNTFYNNLKQLGDEWYDDNGHGVSALPRTTYRECVEDITDGVGPATQEEVDTFLANKPWEKHWKHPFPLIKQIAESKKPDINIHFTRPFGDFVEYEEAILEELNYAVQKYDILRDSSLKVILLEHGYAGLYLNTALCDCYFRFNDDLSQRLIKRINDKFSWFGKFEVVAAPVSYGEAPEYDVPTEDKPFGSIMSAGDSIDASINGTYVNGLGQVVDNGTDNFDTIIVLNAYFHSDDTDVLYETREILGNFIFTSRGYMRDETDADGTDYDAADIDEDYYSIKVFDGTGYPGTPGCLEDPDNCGANPPVNKGSKENPTTVIICGTLLGNAQQAGREKLTQAEVKAIVEAIEKAEGSN